MKTNKCKYTNRS